MAITHSAIANPTPYPPISVSSGTSMPNREYGIQGKMLKCESRITMEQWEKYPTEWVKRKMLELMLEEMLKENCIEFTMMKDPGLMDMVSVRARIFVTPDEQVRTLRVNGVL